MRLVLLNKVKLKYINVANAVDYACEKYHVKSAGELENQWRYYLEAGQGTPEISENQ